MMSSEGKHAGGRPLKYGTPDQLQELIDSYFKDIESPKAVGENVYFEPATITGLCLHLDTTRETLREYEQRPEFVDTIKKAKMKVECYAERMLHIGKNQSGAIFALKNFGWHDTVKSEVSGPEGGPIKTENALPPEDKALLDHYYKTRGKSDESK